MQGFRAAFVNELVKLFKKKKIIVAAILSALAVLIGQAAVTAVNLGFGLRVAGSVEFPLLVLPIFAYTILPLFSTFTAIDMFNGEYNANSMKLTLTRPVSRFGVFCSKVAGLAVFIMGNLLFVMLLTLLTGFLFNPVSEGWLGIVRVVIAYVATFLPVFVFTLLVVLLCNMIRSGLAVFFLAVLLFICFYVLSMFFSHLSSFFITSMFDWYTLWISEEVNVLLLFRRMLLLIGCGIMLFTAAFYAFDRKDI